MQLLVMDYETFFDREYSLRKISAAEYILDQRFQALGCGFVRPGQKGYWIDGPDLPAHFATIDWDDTFAVCHNGLFDHCISAWQYGIKPKLMGDTMAMARNWWAYDMPKGVSLLEMSRRLGRAEKMSTLHRTMGKTLEMIMAEPDLYQELQVYGPDDAVIALEAFTAMMEEGFPPAQLEIIDRQIRMCTEPQFVVNQGLLSEYLASVIAGKEELLNKIGMTREETSALQSNPQLAALLLAHGVTPPMKKNAKGEDTWAFAKTDEDFTDLLEHPDPMIQAIVGARLGVKSTIEETRTQRFINIGNLFWPNGQPCMPIPLKYSGAHTHRFSGDWSLNPQNLGRESEIRNAIEAPAGKVVVSVDSSQVEARLNATLSRWTALQNGRPCSTLVDRFAAGEDVYATFAGATFKIPDLTKATHPSLRFVGKVGILSLGYGASWPVFQGMCRVQSKGKENLDDAMSLHVVTAYRDMFPEIAYNWSFAELMIGHMANAMEGDWRRWGPLWVGRQVIVLPNGNRLNYKDLHQEFDDKGKLNWFYTFGRMRKKLYGPKLVENVIQALAFVLIMEADRRVRKMTQDRMPLAHQVHDELIYVVPEGVAEMVGRLVATEVSRRPDWMPDVPLAAEAKVGPAYGLTKQISL